MNLTEPESVHAFTAARDGPLHVLVANAGVTATPEQYTPLPAPPGSWWSAPAATNARPWCSTTSTSRSGRTTRGWARDGITANALTPGAHHTGDTVTPQQGAATSVLLANA